MQDHPVASMLRTFLSGAVMLEIDRLRQLPEAERFRLLRETAERVESDPPDLGKLLTGSDKPGEVAETFAFVAKMLAVLAFQPGGVTFLGDHYEA